MNLALKILIGVFGGGGFTATTSWFIYDNVNPTLAKRYKDDWKPIQLTINKPPEAPSEDPYKGSSCFNRFSGNIEIQKFNKEPSGSLGSQTAEPIFNNNSSNIYGCSVGDGNEFYELVLKNDDTGFATWYDKNKKYQKSFVLEKKEDNGWKVKLGVWTQETENPGTYTTAYFLNGNGNLFWLFMMSKAETQDTSENSDTEWPKEINKGTLKAIYKDNDWKTKTNQSSVNTFIKIENLSNFNKVENLDKFCQEKGTVRKNQQTNEIKDKVKTFCLID